MSSAQRREPSSWPRLGRLLVGIGDCVLIAALLLYVADILYSAAHGRSLLVVSISWFGMWTVALLLAWLAIKMVHWGRRMQVLSGSALLARDPRPPILYLRSFRDDPVTHTVFDRLFTRLNYRTEEEELAATFADVGPLVAVGHPGELLPELGAARFYFSDDAWKEQVGAMMASARFVLLRVGGSRGLAWELARAVRTLTPEKLLLVVGDERTFAAFLGVIDAELAERLKRLRMERGVGSMRGFIAFGPGFEPRYLPLRRSLLRWTFTHPYLHDLRTALRSIFEEQNLPFVQPPFPVLRTVVITILAAVTLYLGFSR